MSKHADEFDVSGKGGAVQAPPDLLSELRNQIIEATKLEAKVDQLEADAAAARQSLHKIRTQIIPDLMARAQSDHFTHAGWEVKVQDFVSGSLPSDPDKKAKAIAWLEKHDGGGLVKTALAIAFSRNERKAATKLYESLAKKGLPVSLNETVHPQTLAAYVRARIADGEPIDLDALGVFTGKIARFKKLEEKK